MRILLTVDPEIPVPPTHYGGIERIVDMLIHGLIEKGVQVTLIANPNSNVSCELIPWRGSSSRGTVNNIQNTYLLTKSYFRKYDLIHSFSRLLYLTPILPFSIPKIMSYQREPSLYQIKKSILISKKGSLFFTGCSDYITNKIKTVAPATTIYNGVDIARFKFSDRVSSNAPLVFLGRIEYIKGVHVAIDIALKTGRKLIIAGNIPPEEKHQSYFNAEVKPYLGEQIQYVGPVNDSEKNDILRNAYAFLMPILWNEPFGIVMIEALACGTPVIGFNRGAVPEIVQNGINGFVCNDIYEAYEAVMRVPDVSRANCRKIAEHRFSQSVIVKNYMTLYEKHINKNLNYD